MWKQRQLVLMTSLASVLTVQAGWADSLPQLRGTPQPTKTVKEWVAQMEAAQNETPQTVTGIKLERTETGLDITLETADGKPLQVDATQFTREGNALVARISNAVLALPEGKEFRADNPTSGIAGVTVAQVDATTLQVSVTGNTAPPETEVTLKTAGLAYSLNPDSEDDEEVVVTGAGQRGYFVPNTSTATGTNTPVLETPFSVQVVPQEVLREQQVTRIEEAVGNVSGVVSLGDVSGRGSAFNIRGFGTITNPVPLMRDGYRIYNNFQSIPEIFNLERVEVLKGPASILYGQAEPGGVINLVSKQPLSRPFYSAELQVGNRNFVSPRLDLSGPLTPDGSLLYRLSSLYRREDFFENYDNSFNRFTIAPVLSWKIDRNTDLQVALEYINDKSPYNNGTLAFGNGIIDIPADRVTNNPDDTLHNRFLSVGYTFEHRFNQNWKVANAFRYMSYDYDYSVQATPFFFDEETGILTRFFTDQDGNLDSYSLSTNLTGEFSTGSVNHKLLVGVDLNRNTFDVLTRVDFDNISPIDIFNPNYDLVPKPSSASIPIFASGFRTAFTTSDRLGIYLQDQIYLLNNLILVAGFRYDTVTQKTSNESEAVSQSDDAFSPRVGLIYLPVKEFAIYANYSESFNPNEGTGEDGEALPAERGRGFEVGVKSELFDRNLLLNLSYFNITKQNVAVAAPNFLSFSVPTGEQKSQGLELDIVGEPIPGWRLIASYALINAEITEDTNLDLIGNRLPGVARNIASLWTTYEIQAGALKGLGFGAGFNFVDRRSGDLENSFEVSSYLIGNAAIFYRRDNYRFALNFRNLSNARYIESTGTSRLSGNLYGDPFTVLASFSIQF